MREEEIIFVNNIKTQTRGNGSGEVEYNLGATTTAMRPIIGLEQDKLIPIYLPTMGKGIDEKFADIYRTGLPTGEIEKEIAPAATERIREILDFGIRLIDEVLEVYNDEIERINTFSLFEENIKSLWELREEANQNFVDVLVLLEVAVKNSHYENYQEKQYKAIKTALEKIKEIHITTQQVKECRKLLMDDNGIDLFAPIRNWESYTIELKKIDER